MNEYVVHEEKYKELTIKIIQDDDAQSPMEWDMLGRQMYWHKRMNLGHCWKETNKYNPEEWLQKEVGKHLDVDNWDVYSKKYEDWETWDMEKLFTGFEKYNLVIPVHAYEHGGITISASGGRAGWDSFDSGQLGFVYVSHEDILKEYSKKRITKKLLERAEKVLIAEVSEYDDYLNGNVWGFIIENENEEQLDSCWGFIGDYEKGCLEDARSNAECWVKSIEAEQKLIDKRMIE